MGNYIDIIGTMEFPRDSEQQVREAIGRYSFSDGELRNIFSDPREDLHGVVISFAGEIRCNDTRPDSWLRSFERFLFELRPLLARMYLWNEEDDARKWVWYSRCDNTGGDYQRLISISTEEVITDELIRAMQPP